MSVQRYEMECVDWDFYNMEKDPEGDYVKYSDYEKLEAENGKLREDYHLTETAWTNELEKRVKLERALNSLYQPLCDLMFCFQNDPLDDTLLLMQTEAFIEIEKIAKSNEWFKNKLIEVEG